MKNIKRILFCVFLICSSKTFQYTFHFILCVYKRYKWNKMTTNITLLFNDNLGTHTVFTLSMTDDHAVCFYFSFRLVHKSCFSSCICHIFCNYTGLLYFFKEGKA